MSLPLFVLLGLGCFLTHKGMFSDDYIARTTNLVYYVMLPAKLFLDISHVDLGVAFEPKSVPVTDVGGMIRIALAWVCGHVLCPDKSQQSASSPA